jgi:hypothetical protein
MLANSEDKQSQKVVMSVPAFSVTDKAENSESVSALPLFIPAPERESSPFNSAKLPVFAKSVAPSLKKNKFTLRNTLLHHKRAIDELHTTESRIKKLQLEDVKAQRQVKRLRDEYKRLEKIRQDQLQVICT